MRVLAAGHLGNNANKVTPPLSGKEKRLRRWARRQALRAFTTVKRLRQCGITRRSLEVDLKASEIDSERVGFSGVVTCGSVWACPSCNAKIMATRGAEVSEMVSTWCDHHNGSILLLTLTLQHSKGDRLDHQWGILSKAWTKAVNGAPWKRWKKRLGCPPGAYIRAAEVTDGANGWHSHFHVLLFIENQDNYDQIDAFREFISARWAKCVRSLGGDALESVQDVRTIKSSADPAIAGYLTKAQDSLGLELTHSQGKSERGRLGTKPYWYLIDQIMEGDADAVARWQEVEQASHGKRQMTYGRGLREYLGYTKEKTDEEIAEEAAGDQTLVTFPSHVWDGFAKTDLPPQILNKAQDGIGPLVAFLDEHSIDYQTELV